eukprot:g456.t1
MPQKKKDGGDDWIARLAASSIGSVVAETLTLPTDVTKVRLQVQNVASGGAKYNGMFGCMSTMAKEEGPASLWKGLAPALLRQVCYTGLAMVIYEPIRELVSGEANKPNFLQRLLAGGSAGAISITIFNPTEVLKTQIQTSTDSKSMSDVVRRVYRNQGIGGFWAGLYPNVCRTFLVNAAELGTYDEAKHALIPHLGDNFFAHIGASGVAGFASACVSTPADVVKTRLMNQAGGAQQYKGMLDCIKTVYLSEGFFALYKGFFPILARKLLWTSAFFVTYEKARKIANN